MNPYAIVDINTKQYLVKTGTRLAINGTFGKEGETMTMGKVLLVSDDKIEIGTPTLSHKLEVKVVKYQRSPKIQVSTYKAKSRHRRVIGHRQDQTLIEIVSFGTKPVVKKAEPKKPAVKKAPAKKTPAKK